MGDFILAPEFEFGLGGGGYFRSYSNVVPTSEMMSYWVMNFKFGYQI